MLKKIIIILIFIIGINFSLQAQDDTTGTETKQKFKKAVKEKLMQKLDIDKTTADKLWKLFNEQKKVLKTYNQNKKELMKSIEENPDASDVMQKINDLTEIDDKINKSNKNFINELQKFLTPKQIAQTISFQNNLRKLLHRERGKNK